MANLEATTVNTAGDGNVDILPADVVTGYQNQNTLAVSRALGFDSTTVIATATGVTIKAGGTVEDKGTGFVVVDDTTLVIPNPGTYFIFLEDTVVTLEKNFNYTNFQPTWNPIHNAYYTPSGQRVLDVVVTRSPQPDLPVSVAPVSREEPSTFYVRFGYSASGSGVVTLLGTAIPFLINYSLDGSMKLTSPTFSIPDGDVTATGEVVNGFIVDAAGNLLDFTVLGEPFPRRANLALNGPEQISIHFDTLISIGGEAVSRFLVYRPLQKVIDLDPVEVQSQVTFVNGFSAGSAEVTTSIF